MRIISEDWTLSERLGEIDSLQARLILQAVAFHKILTWGVSPLPLGLYLPRSSQAKEKELHFKTKKYRGLRQEVMY
jgi:hypothetical protein